MFTTGKQLTTFYVVCGIIALFVGVVISLEMRSSGPPLPRYFESPEFKLVNQDNESVTLSDLRGKVWLADFVYTTCPGPCPLITAHMAKLQGEVPSPDVRFVSFSTDPNNDTPAVLKKYAQRFNAGDRWIFLTGEQQDMYNLLRLGFRVAVLAPPGQPVIHSTKILLVDRAGTVRSIYDGSTEHDDPQILQDIDRLLHE